jgi:hypothetical protein
MRRRTMGGGGRAGRKPRSYWRAVPVVLHLGILGASGATVGAAAGPSLQPTHLSEPGPPRYLPLAEPPRYVPPAEAPVHLPPVGEPVHLPRPADKGHPSPAEPPGQKEVPKP